MPYRPDHIEDNTHDIALICWNGHVTNGAVRSAPQFNTKHCEICGEKNITECPTCAAPIRGQLIGGGMVMDTDDAPNHCHNCGHPYPWTEKRLKEARELIALSDLPEEQKRDYGDAVEEIARQGAAAKTAAQKIKVYSKRVAKEIGSGVYQFTVDVASEAIKKMLKEP